jgi:hypothetical protein
MHRDFGDLPSLLAVCCRFDPEDLLKSPAQLGAFLAASRLISEIEPRAQSAAINFALRGIKIPGFTLVRHETPGYVEPETLAELFLHCQPARIPALLSAVATMCGHLSGERYRRLCVAAEVTPSEHAIKHAGANPFLRQDPPLR